MTAASVGHAAPVGASVDLGSTSVHLLVAEIDGHRLTPIVDESVFLGLGAAVAERGYLGAEARTELVETLVGYADAARRLGARDVTFVGTEPIRRAADASRIVAEVVAASGAPLHVLTHEEEAFATLIGVTEGMPVTHETLVVDVGGGSSEFCAVDSVRPPRAVGHQARIGAVDRPVRDPRSAAPVGSGGHACNRAGGGRGSPAGQPVGDRGRWRNRVQPAEGPAGRRR